MRKLGYIDALRGWAVIGILMVHTGLYGRLDSYPLFYKIIMQGARGVQLFYVASAFTLFLSFQNRIGRESFPIKNFFIRRFFRIAPMYYLGIIYYIMQDGLGPRYWLGDASHISFANILSNVFFLHGFSSYWINSVVPGGWSIAIEMAFYIVLPFLFFRIKNRNDALLFFTISIIIKTLLYIVFSNFPLISDKRLWEEYLFMYFPSQLPVFALGILLYFYSIDISKEGHKCSGKLLLFIGLSLWFQLATGIDYIFPEHILWSAAFYTVALALSRYTSLLLVNPIINYIGKLSFSMYLVHFAVLYWLLYFDFTNYFADDIINYTVRFYIVVMVTVLISSITYKYIELPFQKLGKTIIGMAEEKAKLKKM